VTVLQASKTSGGREFFQGVATPGTARQSERSEKICGDYGTPRNKFNRKGPAPMGLPSPAAFKMEEIIARQPARRKRRAAVDLGCRARRRLAILVAAAGTAGVRGRRV